MSETDLQKSQGRDAARLFRSSLPQILRYALLGAICLLLAVIIVLAWQLRGEFVAFQEEPEDNLQWNVTQLELDLVRLETETQLAILQPAANLDELRKRYDLFYSRAKVLAQGSLLARLGDTDETRAMAKRSGDFLVWSAPIIDGPDSQLRASLGIMLRSVSDLRRDLRGMVIKVISQTAEVSDARRNSVAGLLRKIALTSFALATLLAMLSSLVVWLNRQAQRRAAELAELSSRLEATVETSLDGIIQTDLQGNILDFNAAACAIFGYDRAEVIGRPLRDLIVSPGAFAMVDTGRRRLDARAKSGRLFPIEMAIAQSHGAGGREAKGGLLIAFLRDISDRIAAEHALIAARDEALAAEQSKTNFLAVMSHEMRTPLNGVMAALELAAHDSASKKQGHFLTVAQQSAERLLEHVNDVLDISKIDAGHMALAERPFDLGAVLEGLVEAQRPMATERGNRISLRLPADLPRMQGDPFRLGQIVQNYLSNAIKFTENGLITVEAEVQQRTEAEIWVEIRVSDDGIGIAEADQLRVFDDFVMIDPSYGRNSGGTGLGLAISRRLADLLGGSVGVESERGLGSCFWLRLPLRLALREVEIQPSHPDLPSLDVLVVEDNAINRMVMQEMLIQLGQRVTLAEDGAVGVSIAANRPFDVILMDISMPVMDGMTATRQIRAGGASRSCRIIAVTAHAMPEEQAQFHSAGMNGWLTKPISSASLAQVLQGGEGANPAAETGHDLWDRAKLNDLRAAMGARGFAKLIDHFRSEIKSILAELGSALGRADTEALAAQAHAGAGAAGMIGALPLSLAFQNLELHAHAKDIHAAKASTSRITTLLGETLVDLPSV